MSLTKIKTLFLDVGGVLLTNGWDHDLRDKAVATFGIDKDEMESRHKLVFDTFEIGKMTFEEYLNYVIFYEPRSFSMEDIKSFIFDSVRPYQETIDYFKRIKKEHHLKVVMISNEGKELALDRFERFKLNEIFDFFIVSSFIHLRKPDSEIYSLAMAFSQDSPGQVLYIDDRDLFIDAAKKLGIRSLQHQSLENTQRELRKLLS